LYSFAKPRETPLADNYVLDTSKRIDPEQFTLLSRLREKNSEVDLIDMAAESLDHMAAGIDTTGDGLCFLMWELSQPRSFEFQRRLQQELRQHRDAPIESLPLLDAVVTEGLRCFAPIPMSLPRYAPAGGRTIDAYWIPERTVVSCQAHSVHRMDQGIFPDSDRYNPDRWLAGDGDTERRRMMFAFSNGGRGCVGKQ
jgi:cytochrome P450